MDIVLDILLPVFAIIAIGFIGVRFGFFPKQVGNGLSAITFKLLIPILLFSTISKVKLPTEIPWSLFLSYWLPVVIIYIISFFTSVYIFKKDLQFSVIAGVAATFSNASVLGLALAIIILPETSKFAFLMILSLHGFFFFLTNSVLMEIFKHKIHFTAMIVKIGKSLITNAILVGITLGLTVNLLGINLPAPIYDTTKLLSGAVAPCALISLGFDLYNYGIKSGLKQSIFITLLKSIIMPILVFTFGKYIFGLNDAWLFGIVLFAVQPIGFVPYIFAKNYNIAVGLVSSSITITSVLSIATLWVVLSYFL